MSASIAVTASARDHVLMALGRVEREAGFLLRTESERVTGEILMSAASDLREALALLPRREPTEWERVRGAAVQHFFGAAQ